MQMILFITDETSAALLERPRKAVRSVVRHSAVMLIDRPAPESASHNQPQRKPLPPRMPAVLPEPVINHEEEVERWDGLY